MSLTDKDFFEGELASGAAPTAGAGSSQQWRAMKPISPEGGHKWRRLRELNGRYVWKPATDAQLKACDDKPMLLFLHGTGRRTKHGFEALTADKSRTKRLMQRYEGRVFAFDHRTVRCGIVENAGYLFDTLPKSFTLWADIVAHSRGGLLARYIAEGWGTKAMRGRREVMIDKVVFMGTPNGGTPTSGRPTSPFARNMLLKWNGRTRRLARVGRGPNYEPPVYTRQELISIAKQPIETPNTRTRRGEPWEGARDQFPGSAIIRKLNGKKVGPYMQEEKPVYHFMSSTFEAYRAEGPGRMPVFAAEVQFALFGHVPNDMVCPTGGVYAPLNYRNPRRLFPVYDPKRTVVLKPAAMVTHVGYMQVPKLRERVVSWLEAD